MDPLVGFKYLMENIVRVVHCKSAILGKSIKRLGNKEYFEKWDTLPCIGVYHTHEIFPGVKITTIKKIIHLLWSHSNKCLD